MRNLSRISGTILTVLVASIPLNVGAASVRPQSLSLDILPVPLIEVRLDRPGDRERLSALDLDVIQERKDLSARILAWPGTIDSLRASAFSFKVIHEDHGAYLSARNRDRPLHPDILPMGPTSIPPQGMGGMGGFYTLAEIETFLSDLAAGDTQGIVSNVVAIGTSRLGRPISAIRIASEAFPDHSRPRVLFTALTHAREPIGMQSLIDFMTRLVLGYGTDPNLTYLIDRREMWFVPCVNPDGYAINENTWNGSGSFGMWRKNARDNDNSGNVTSDDGVDVNRNFNYQWGYNNAGSSPTPSAFNYRGPSAWSEPETRAIRDFGTAHQFATANNIHTFGEYCFYPWGYNSMDCPDSVFFRRMSDDMCRDVSYNYGVSADFLYQVNGGAGDWFYGEVAAKPRCFAVTTEIGDDNDDFWPPAADIPALAASQQRSHMVLAYTAGVHVHAEKASLVSADGYLHPGGSAEVSLTLRHAGLAATTGAVQVAASTTIPGITITDPVSTFPAMSPGTTATPSGGDLIGLSASAWVTSGAPIPLVLTITDQGSHVRRDTIDVHAGVPTVAFSDNASGGTGNWTISSRWGIQFVNGDPVFADSPNALHTTSAVAILTKNAPLDLSGAARAYLRFNTWYDIEVGPDAGRVEASTDGGLNWTGLPGRLTRRGHGMTGDYASGTQALNEPCYDGSRAFELPEVMDLSAYVGLTDLRLRFRFTADEAGRRDGWFVDDIQVLVYPAGSTGVAEAPGGRPPLLSAASPNPFGTATRATATFPGPSVYTATVHAVDGRLIRVLADGIAAGGPRDIYWDGSTRDGAPAAPGAYFIRIQSAGGSASEKVIKAR